METDSSRRAGALIKRQEIRYIPADAILSKSRVPRLVLNLVVPNRGLPRLSSSELAPVLSSVSYDVTALLRVDPQDVAARSS